MISSPPGISAFPESDSDMFRWIGTIEGPRDSVYDKLKFKVLIEFPDDYPYDPPYIRFTSPMWHPNIDNLGHICLDILQDRWSAVYTTQTVLISLQSLLETPNTLSPMNPTAARQWDNDMDAFRAQVLTCYR
jgi:ubiquitin-conjugating enzyme E2 C